MDGFVDYFPTKAVKLAEARFGAVLRAELARLGGGRLSLGQVRSTLPAILEFSAAYHQAFMGYLEAVLPQHKHRVQCGPGCGNCCRHYPMSIEPFEHIAFYAHLREAPGLFGLLEACLARTREFARLRRERAAAKGGAETADDAEEAALQEFFAAGLWCPFLAQESGRCKVYEWRPVTCRMYFSETPPEFCSPEFLLTERNRSFIVCLPDELEAAIAEVSSRYEALELPEAFFAGVVRMNELDGELFA